MIVENCIKIIFVVPLLHLCFIFILKGVCHKIFSFFHDLNSPGPRIKSEVVSNWVSILPRYYIIKLENSESTVCKTPRSPKILGLVSPHFVCLKSCHSWYKCSPMKEFYLSVPLGATLISLTKRRREFRTLKLNIFTKLFKPVLKRPR